MMGKGFNMKFKIKYCYNTGDSDHTTRDLEDYLELVWSNLDVVKENMRRIKEHYDWYRNGAWEDKALNKHWAVKAPDGKRILYSYCIILKSDDGADWQFSAPWCGYFESLNWIEICIDSERITMD